MQKVIYRCTKCGNEVKVNFLPAGSKCPVCGGTLVYSGMEK